MILASIRREVLTVKARAPFGRVVCARLSSSAFPYISDFTSLVKKVHQELPEATQDATKFDQLVLNALSTCQLIQTHAYAPNEQINESSKSIVETKLVIDEIFTKSENVAFNQDLLRQIFLLKLPTLVNLHIINHYYAKNPSEATIIPKDLALIPFRSSLFNGDFKHAIKLADVTVGHPNYILNNNQILKKGLFKLLGSTVLITLLTKFGVNQIIEWGGLSDGWRHLGSINSMLLTYLINSSFFITIVRLGRQSILAGGDIVTWQKGTFYTNMFRHADEMMFASKIIEADRQLNGGESNPEITNELLQVKDDLEDLKLQAYWMSGGDGFEWVEPDQDPAELLWKKHLSKLDQPLLRNTGGRGLKWADDLIEEVTMSRLTIKRLISHKAHPENVILADALNLLSPSEIPKAASSFKPSLLTNFAKGSANERFNSDDLIKVKLPASGVHESAEVYLNNLLMGLQSSRIMSAKPNYQILEMSPKELATYIKSTSSEQRLFELMELFYYQNKLTPRIMTDIILNKHFVNVHQSPLKLTNLEALNLSWRPINYTQIDILLMKKYHDLKKPLLILKNLKENFVTKYYPLVEANKLSPFYERIVWKFNFEYIKNLDEFYYIRKLNSLKSSFIIWESSLENNHRISQYILENISDLSEIQKLFLRVCCNDVVQTKVNEQLQVHQNSKLLSDLKKLSIKYKVNGLSDAPSSEVRMNYYSLIKALEEILAEAGDENGLAIRDDLKRYKEMVVMKLGVEDQEIKWLNDQFLSLVPKSN
ncbi:uncharacterized protein CANTADRAFT_3831 [Suhomyces tanzawaensis NRRL Y-17324]|uniref:Uncharacterized protein n=1 Tax=Suhomyces tanzawaensis NRRL Y-17324 TaxID=984487 RepID=A0A1E4SQI7_9ASCO|nr:uncharacterized protein CANTADRAFT_3831 [Suhomyces tanzawaensis NRRL Y-17324]ODV81758.1 hypothetical protein CANTADRAFT_3831 [Suhomyces tanzawaensis NRRL Y-17324]